MLPKSFVKPAFSAMAIAACVLTGGLVTEQGFTGGTQANAQGLPGITFRWNNREGFHELSHVIELSNSPNNYGRYRLQLKASDMKLAASQFTVNIPDHFDGKFDEKEIELRVCSTPGNFLRRAKCEAVPVDDVRVDMEARQIAIYPAQPIPAKTNVELVFSNVKNPRSPGMYQFNGLVEVPGDVPLLRPLGAWILTFDRG